MTKEPTEANPITSAHALGYRHGLEGGEHEPTEEVRHRFLALAAYQRGKRIGTRERVMKALGRSK